MCTINKKSQSRHRQPSTDVRQTHTDSGIHRHRDSGHIERHMTVRHIVTQTQTRTQAKAKAQARAQTHAQAQARTQTHAQTQAWS